ncbi:MAG TPA: rhodanese-like domain-containing protein [Thermoanaerobaculia bacterium]|nr:rhodanese-like domain-containing protein [Thermoanaerobaculia bacterium]
MNVRRHLLEAATLLLVAVVVALVSNGLASRERKLKLPGDYPNATTVTKAAPAGDSSAPEQAVKAESSPATAQQGSASSASKVNREPTPAPAKPRGAAAASAESAPSRKSPVSFSPASPAFDPVAAFPPHPDKPYVEISGEDAARLHAAGVPFLDARRTSAFEEGHVAGARPVSVWESDVDEKVLALIGEQDGKKPLVLYCSGGDCEDSHLLAQKLWGAGFNNNLVYRDGFPDWVRRGGAVRTGTNP